jgi:hypothetical protein
LLSQALGRAVLLHLLLVRLSLHTQPRMLSFLGLKPCHYLVDLLRHLVLRLRFGYSSLLDLFAQ